MRFTEISESTTAGSVSTVAMPLGGVQSRTQVAGLEPAEKVMKGKAKKKGPYANSLSEGKVKELSMDLKDLKDKEFQSKYKMTKADAKKNLSSKPTKQATPVSEAELSEDDIILVPGQGRKSKTGFIPHGQSRLDHEVEMARSDLFSSAKNAKQIHELISNVSEDEGLEGWVQEKIIKANDYLNTVREYLEGKQLQQEMSSGITYEGASEDSSNPYDYEKGQTVKLHNGGQGRVLDILDDSIEVLLPGGRTVTVAFQDATVIDEQRMAEGMERAVDAKGRTQEQWAQLVRSKFPGAKITQAKMIDGPMQATLPDGRKIGWSKVEQAVAEEWESV